MARLLSILVLGGALVYGLVAVTSPWAFHIGGRWTPLLYWSGSGQLVTTATSTPLYLYLYPASHFSHLHLDGLRPTGGVIGKAWLCTSPGVMQYLTMSGTIYGGWRSTEASLMSVRFVEPTVINLGQRQGYFDLFGRWKGRQLVMNDRGHVSGTFRSGLKVDHASVTLDYASYSDFKAQCANANK
jgi:hypothetical protein